MRKIFFIALLALAASTMAQQSDELRVKIDNTGLGNSIVAKYAGNTDTITAKKAGKYDFTIKLDEPTELQIASLTNKKAVYDVVAVPGNTVNIKLDNKYEEGWTTIGGTGFYKNYNEVDTLLYFAQKPLNDLVQDCQQRIKNGEDETTVLEDFRQNYVKSYRDIQNRYLAYINEHSNSELSTILIPYLIDEDAMRQAIDLLSPDVREGRMRPIFMKRIIEQEEENRAKEEMAKRQAEGVEAPDFTLNDINGKPLTLSSLRGKYVVLDFWGSWCGWCIKGMPQMKEYYAKYAGKFEIVGVDCGDTDTAWRAAVEKHQLPWLHVFCPQDDLSVPQQYGITGFPTKILINPEGKIDKTVVGEDPAFYTYLDEKFGN